MPAIDPQPPRAAVDAATAAARGPLGWLPRRRERAYVTAPLQLFVMRLTPLARFGETANGIAELAEAVGWRFLTTGAARHAAIEVSDRGGPAQIETSPFVEATESALERIEERPQLAHTVFEPRMLRIPDLHMMSVWLVSASGEEHVLPLAPAPERFIAQELYEVRQFLYAASSAARIQLEAAQRRDFGVGA
jgi:hypothetical protein